MVNSDTGDDVVATADTSPQKKRRLLPKILVGLVVVLAFAAAGLYLYAGRPAQPTDRAIAALQSDESVTVTSGQWIEFSPTGTQPTTGLIVYPGGLVDPRAYAPIARAVAERGYLVAIVPMPLNLAVLAPDRARDVIAAHPEIEHWAVGGHSLGGAMAARFAYSHPELADGLALWAAYPAGTDSLAGRDLAVTSIYGTNDGLATGEKIDASRALLPPGTVWVEIPGGNHAQTGSYGPQSGDNPASIAEEAQQSSISEATAALLQRISR